LISWINANRGTANTHIPLYPGSVAMVTHTEQKVLWLHGTLTQVEIWKEAAAELNV